MFVELLDIAQQAQEQNRQKLKRALDLTMSNIDSKEWKSLHDLPTWQACDNIRQDSLELIPLESQLKLQFDEKEMEMLSTPKFDARSFYDSNIHVKGEILVAHSLNEQFKVEVSSFFFLMVHLS